LHSCRLLKIVQRSELFGFYWIRLTRLLNYERKKTLSRFLIQTWNRSCNWVGNYFHHSKKVHWIFYSFLITCLGKF
jgi:hypothetical protein